MDYILFNGQIITLDGSYPTATALAVKAGRIAAVGDTASILSLASPNTRLNNLDGQTVVPGLVDAHVHWQRFAESRREVNLDGVRSKAQALEKIAELAQNTSPGSWITGFGWSHDLWGEVFPTARDLDAIAPDHPVYLRGRSGHNAWVNSAALRVAGIDRETPAPEGAEIVRDADGEPTGILLEWGAMALVSRHIPTLSAEQIADIMRDAQAHAHALGMTGLHDFDDQPCLAGLQVMRERGELGLRVLKNVNLKYLDSLLHMGLRTGFGDDWLRIGALKLFADGSLGAHTALMLEPYTDDPDNMGLAVTSKADMLDAATRATLAGLPTTIHAIGDRAVRDVLDVFEAVRALEAERGIPRSARRHRIEHVQCIHPDDAPCLARLGLIASMQPIHATSDWQIAERAWGLARSAWSYNPRLQLDYGAVVAFGSDAPYDHLGIMAGIHAAVTRRRADGSPGVDGWMPAAKVTIDEALRAYTVAPAYAAGMEDRLGRIKPTYLADLTVLDADPYAVEPDALLEIGVVGTMVGGEWRYGEWA
jgi:predicted amidohydrolase YtcJ